MYASGAVPDNNPSGSLYIDTADNSAVWLQSRNKLKLTSNGDMSINAGSGKTVYADGNWRIGANGTVTLINRVDFLWNTNVDFSGANVSFTGANVTGLTARWA
jgi:hypothetical protein